MPTEAQGSRGSIGGWTPSDTKPPLAGMFPINWADTCKQRCVSVTVTKTVISMARQVVYKYRECYRYSLEDVDDIMLPFELFQCHSTMQDSYQDHLPFSKVNKLQVMDECSGVPHSHRQTTGTSNSIRLASIPLYSKCTPDLARIPAPLTHRVSRSSNFRSEAARPPCLSRCPTQLSSATETARSLHWQHLDPIVLFHQKFPGSVISLGSQP